MKQGAAQWDLGPQLPGYDVTEEYSFLMMC